MEKSTSVGGGGGGGPQGLRQMNLEKSFRLALRSLLTTCSKEEFSKAFPRFGSAEQERLHRLFIQVITSLHGNIEDEFESLCLETQVGTALDTIEQLSEEQSLDPLFSEKTPAGDVEHDLLMAKKNEVQYLMGMLKKAEEQKHIISARLELLTKGSQQDLSATSDVIEKLRSGILSYGAYTNNGLHDT